MSYPHPMDDTTGFEATDAELGLGLAPALSPTSATVLAFPDRTAPSQWQGQIRYEFEELALFQDGKFSAGLVQGYATIAFLEDGLWWVDELFIELENHKFGAEARTAFLEIKVGDLRFSIINDILSDEHNAVITDKVMDDLEGNA